MSDPTKSETPGGQGKGFPEQLSIFPTPEFCPILPPPHSLAMQALRDLTERDLTQIDWLTAGHGWRLSAAIKELDYHGWQPRSILVSFDGRARPVAQYSLHQKAKHAAALALRGCHG